MIKDVQDRAELLKMEIWHLIDKENLKGSQCEIEIKEYMNGVLDCLDSIEAVMGDR